MLEYLDLEQTLGPYETARRESALLGDFYAAAAELIGASPECINFCDSGTRGFSVAVSSIDFPPNSTVVTSTHEFGSNLIVLERAKQIHGFKIRLIEPDSYGQIDCDELLELVDDSTVLVSLTHQPAHSGAVVNSKEIASALLSRDVIYLLDACQTVGQMPVSVAEAGCDILVTTGRKWLRGPRGTGFLYVSPRAAGRMRTSVVDLANTDYVLSATDSARIVPTPGSRQFELWERSLVLQRGLTVAIRELEREGGPAYRQEISAVAARRLREFVRDKDYLELFGPVDAEGAIVTFRSTSVASAKIRDRLRAWGINVSVVSSWDAPIDFERKLISDLVRVSPNHTTRSEDIEQLFVCLNEIHK